VKVEFTREAEDELVDATLWYESKESGLGTRFRDEISRVVARIGEDATLWRIYRVDSDTVIILYVMRSERLLRSYVLDQRSADA